MCASHTSLVPACRMLHPTVLLQPATTLHQPATPQPNVAGPTALVIPEHTRDACFQVGHRAGTRRWSRDSGWHRLLPGTRTNLPLCATSSYRRRPPPAPPAAGV
jgi:hypothetical protein